ncbi:MAG: tetratricopeptide repeat protein [Candidatus Muirbacterium halophilum]|nr:tetratricopeptide repeat protein [Candidatus Muirbacterium halophilum]MCK9475899.1 tetratricopeptide repeat protein [Candidatus Muirbacterium halophilum]
MKEKLKIIITIVFVMILTIICWSDEYCENGNCTIQAENLYSFGNIDPTVTQQEADLINKAHEEFEKEPQKALKSLLAKAGEKSSEAIDFSIASFYYAMDKLEKSIEWYKKALDKNNKFNRARANLAQVLLKLQRVEEAALEFQKVAEIGNVSSKTYNLIGYTNMLLGNPISAENAYRQAMLVEITDNSALTGLARSLLMQKRYTECIYTVKEALKNDMKNKDLWHILTNCYAETANYQKAITTLETANLLTKKNYSTHITLGDLYLINSQPDYSWQNYKKAFDYKEAKAKDIVKAAGNLFEYGNIQEAMNIIKNNKSILKKDSKEDKTIKIIEAGILINTQKYTEAQNILEKLAIQYPTNTQILLMNGDLKFSQKEYEKAIIYYERAERTAEDRSQSIIKQAKVEVERENYQKAADLLETAQKLNPQPYIEKYLKQVKRFVGVGSQH